MVGALPAELAEAAERLFGERLDLARAYAELLVTDGVVRGLIGPREAPRIWGRHLLNCAVVAELIPPGATLIDVGSGAGLPGVVLALARPDLAITLIEPLARRAAFLTEVVAKLGLEPVVTVVRARAEEWAATSAAVESQGADIVTARAVAPLDRLAGWCLPLAAVGGRLLALKGASAADEVAEHRATVDRLGGGPPVIRRCGIGLIDPPTTVVEIVRTRVVAPQPPRSARKSSGSRRRPRSR
ncbi:MAG TPA: 16S rRNA (guanine(527)-N(7))-methyltransferase RsmG [Micromonospora sp.]|nr:16S rRNA (guanine(527)-N(7))-methyltransferase RsmG [Micromonospora sp.]